MLKRIRKSKTCNKTIYEQLHDVTYIYIYDIYNFGTTPFNVSVKQTICVCFWHNID